eukprot:jgi/Chlat1/2835/Chrsp19S03025
MQVPVGHLMLVVHGIGQRMLWADPPGQVSLRSHRLGSDLVFDFCIRQAAQPQTTIQMRCEGRVPLRVDPNCIFMTGNEASLVGCRLCSCTVREAKDTPLPVPTCGDNPYDVNDM